MTSRPPSRPPTELLSAQVSAAHYFFLQQGGLQTGPGRLALGGREHCNPDYALERRRYAYHVIEYIAEGTGWVTLDGQSSALGPGSVFIVRPSTHCCIGTSPERPLVKYFLCLAGDRLEPHLRKVGLPLGQVRQIGAHGTVRNLLEQLILEARHGGDTAAAICDLLLEILLLKIAGALTQPTRLAERAWENFLRCEAQVDAGPERIHSLEELASAVGLDPSSVCRLFRRFQGITPYQYLLRAQMNLAAEHLLGSSMLVKEAAQRVGFDDPYHFSRCFKAVHGLSPRDLRRRG